MSNIFVDHNAVQSETLKLSSDTASQLQGADSQLSGLQASLNSKDSSSNASYIRAVDNTKRKMQSTTRGFTKLINFVSGASEQMRLQDERLSLAMRGTLER